MAIQRNRLSRLRFSVYGVASDVEFWDLGDLPDIPAQPDDRVYVVSPLDRVDTLAQKFYGDPILWWVIAVANGADLVPGDLEVGASIRIPSPRFILLEFPRIKTLKKSVQI